MAGKHVKKKGASAAPVRTESRASRSGGDNVYVVTPERSGSAGTYDSYVRRTKKKKKSGAMGWIIAILIVMLAAVGCLGWTLHQANRITAMETIYPNVSVNGINVGGLTMEQAIQVLTDAGADPYRDFSVTVSFPKDKTLVITSADLGLSGDVSAPAKQAWKYGRDGTPLENLKAYRACEKKGVDLTWNGGTAVSETAIDENTLRFLLETAAAEVNTELLETSAEVGEEGVTLTKGMSASHVNMDTLFAKVRQAFLDLGPKEITAEVVTAEPSAAAVSDEELLKSVYDTIFKEPVNAMYDKETGGVTEGVQGVSFDMDEALRLWKEAQPGEKVFIPFVFTDPAVKDLEGKLFADCLSEKATSLSGSSSARINNITLAARAMNDTVLNPGETFDYNSCLGQRTAARGYQEAGAYSGGKHVNEIGGGICQGSSTLYYCAMLANLDITVRYCHYFLVSYLPRGIDATVSWGGPDFRFVNSRDYPIKIKSWVSDGQLYVQIWGTDVDGSYVEITSDTWEDADYYYAQTYRSVYAKDGTRISHEKEAYSSYAKHEAGDDSEQTQETPVAEDTPAPTEAPSETTPTEAPPPPTDPPVQPTDPPAPATDPPAPPPEEPPPAEEPPAEDPPAEEPPAEVYDDSATDA